MKNEKLKQDIFNLLTEEAEKQNPDIHLLIENIIQLFSDRISKTNAWGYAAYCVMNDRENQPIIDIEDYINEYLSN